MSTNDSTGPSIPPGEIANWPLLKVVYRTDPEKIADLLPPGITPGKEPNVHVNIYNVPVKGEPEYGVATKVDAIYDGMEGYYGIGLGIDQESAIFISQELNGQPKFPCSIWNAIANEHDPLVGATAICPPRHGQMKSQLHVS